MIIIITVIILFFILRTIITLGLLFYYELTGKEDFTNILVNEPEEIKEKKVPLNIFQTWSTLNLPAKMKKSVDYVKHQNPEFKHYLYDDQMCGEFIKNNFHEDVYKAFNKLKPGAYKADLWRYCVLYIHGGIYMDIKFQTVEGFKLISIIEKEHFVKDLKESGNGIYNAFMISYPKNPKLLEAIKKIVTNTQNNYYGEGPLSPTGPVLLKSIFPITLNSNVNMDIGEHNGNLAIFHKKTPILICYKGYREEQNKEKNNKPYSYLWHNKDIYL